MSKELGADRPMLERFQLNDLFICLECGVKIAGENNSGWEMLADDGRTTQRICTKCRIGARFGKEIGQDLFLG